LVLGENVAMMFSEVIEARRSVRRFTNEQPKDEDILAICQIGRRAPSAGAIRGYEILTTEQRVSHYSAFVYFVICALPRLYEARYGERGRKLYAIQDATIVAAYMQLAAVDRGLATVWVGAFSDRVLRQKMDLPAHFMPVVIMPLGYELKDELLQV
jgi:nitroreductase